ncbi:hypothetical protein JB92DRAFT_2835123 [Gautieria morchelliformis]|nr:hypothetical protein JB92DRAFT_2835123 [Gautieria morchelliformis]
MDVDFTKDITAAVNVRLLQRARDAARDEIEDMKDAGYRPDSKCLYELAKTTWRMLKDRYLKQTDPRKKKMGQKNQHTARWKANWRRSAIVTFQDMYGFDPSPLLHQDYQSDKASGPEDDLITEENATDMMALWKRNLMEIDGLEGSVDKFNFFEVIHPTWRSHCATTILHKLSDIRDAALTTKDKAAICRIRVYTSRYSNVLPPTAPYDAMISDEWWEKFSKDWDIKDWKTYGNPETLEPFLELPLVLVHRKGKGNEEHEVGDESDAGEVEMIKTKAREGDKGKGDEEREVEDESDAGEVVMMKTKYLSRS